MQESLELYRSQTTNRRIAERLALNISRILNCEAVSIFLYNEAARQLSLLYTTSIKNNTPKLFFGPMSPVFAMFEALEDRTLVSGSFDESEIDELFDKIDITYEKVKKLYSIAYSRVFDSDNSKVALIRAINKKGEKGRSTKFTEKDLEILISYANIFGAALSAKYSDQRMVSFLDSVTHELYAPIASVNSISKFLLGYLRKNGKRIDADILERVRTNILQILDSSELSQALVSNLTSFSRSGYVDGKDLDLRPTRPFRDIIIPSIRSIRPLLKEYNLDQTKIKCENVKKCPLIKADKNMLTQIFSNILNNAIKYSQKDKSLFSIKITHILDQNGNLIIRFADYGIGIDPNLGKSIFHPGKRGTNAKEAIPTSTGIGLATVKNLASIHEIKVKVENLKSPTIIKLEIPKKLIIGAHK